MPRRAIADTKMISSDIPRKSRKLRLVGPEGWILASRYAKEHGVSLVKVHAWMADGRLPYEKRNGRYWVSPVIDPPYSKRDGE